MSPEKKAGEAAAGKTSKHTEKDLEKLQHEVDVLRAENEKLAHDSGLESYAVKTTHTKKNRTRGAIALVIVAAIFLSLSFPAVWLKNTIMNKDQWVSTMAPLAQDVAIQNAVATAASDAMIAKLDSLQLAKEYLPPQAQPLAGPISNSIDGFITGTTHKIVASPQFAAAWKKMNEVAHDALIAALLGTKNGAVTSTKGTVTLDTGVIVNDVKKALDEKGFTALDKLPLTRLDANITLVSSPAIANAQKALNLLQQLAWILPVISLVLLVGALALAADRRKAVIWFAGAVIIALLLPMETLILAKFPLINSLNMLKSVGTAAAGDAYSIIFHRLIVAQEIGIVVGAVVWIVAFIAGPARPAVWLRGKARLLLEKIEHKSETSAA